VVGHGAARLGKARLGKARSGLIFTS